MKTTVFFVTSNSSKVATPTRILARRGIEVKHVNLELVEIQSPTVATVAAAKVRAAFRALQAPVIVNDGSIMIARLNGFPGTYVRHINAQIHVEGYLDLMVRHPLPTQRKCIVQDAVAFIDATRPAPVVFVRTIRGHLAPEARGTFTSSRLTLAPIFIPDGYSKTYAEMNEEEYEAFRRTPENEQMYESLASAILGSQTSFE